jgi:HSP20 family protein
LDSSATLTSNSFKLTSRIVEMANSNWYVGCLFHPVQFANEPQLKETEMLYNLTTASPIFGLRREIDRLFEDTFTRDGNAWTPAVDIKETGNDLRLDLELPGLKPEDVEITTDNGVLTIRGEKRSERKEGEENRYHLVERSYGSFTRSFTLPQGVDENQIQADFQNGVLSVHIPKAALPQPKKIQIGGSQQKQQASVGSGNVSSSAQSNAQQSGGKTTSKQSNTSARGERGSEQMSATAR